MNNLFLVALAGFVFGVCLCLLIAAILYKDAFEEGKTYIAIAFSILAFLSSLSALILKFVN